VNAGRVPENPSPEQLEMVNKLVALYQEQMSYGAEIVSLSELFFKEEISYDETGKAILSEEQVPEVLRAFLQELEDLEPFEAAEIKAAIKRVQKATGQKGKKLFMPIRVAVTGQEHGPELPNTIELLGKETVKKRIHNILS
jgi:nondiscriminating glutamyl-tRNA synthetase